LVTHQEVIMEHLVEKRKGWWWPKYDVACWKFLIRRRNLPAKVSEFCDSKRVVIQAGGNAGMYPAMYGDLFETVYTFEPDPLNFYCLTKNVKDNVVKFQGCVGNNRNLVDISLLPAVGHSPNSGAFQVAGSGSIPTFIIDDFNFKNVDLIHLDIEGFELFALKGAVKTIQQWHPTIALELNGLAERYDHSDHDVVQFLKEHGYERVDTADDDVIFKWVH